MRRRNGFTLLEVLVATLLMAIAITGLLSSLRGSLSNANRQTETERGIALARRQMEELLARRVLPKGALEGRFEPATTGGVEAGWTAQVQLFDWAGAPGSPPGGVRLLERVRLQVWWMEGSARRHLDLTGYHAAQPDPGGGGQ
jgi:general secretion pathway protein I